MDGVARTFDTSRLILRAWTQEDADDFYDYARMPIVGEMAGWPPHESREKSLQIIKEVFLGNPCAWGLFHKQSGRVIGGINLKLDSRRAVQGCLALGYSMSPYYWGQGLMSEAADKIISYAFDALGIQLLSCYHSPQNIRSRRLIRKFGFIYEGTLRHCHQLPNGQITSLLCYSMTRQEYESSRKVP